MLIGKDQDRVLGEGVFDPAQMRGVDWRPQVDVADFGNAPSQDGNTSGSGVEETLRTTSTGPSAVCNIVTAVSSSRICLTVAVWRKPHVRAMPARSTPALLWVGCIPVSP